MIKKNELVTLLSEHAGVPKTYVKPVVDALGEVMTELFAAGEAVILSGLGRFYVTDKKAREGYDPTRDEKIIIPAHKRVRFKVSKKVKDALNPLEDE